MKSEEYRDAIRRIVKNAIRKQFPGLKQTETNTLARYIARNIHARFYGANVDGVESPLWREVEPDVEATEILKGKENEKGTVSSNDRRDYPERSNSAKLP